MRTIRVFDSVDAGLIGGGVLMSVGICLGNFPVCLAGIVIFGIAATFGVWFPWRH